MLSNRSLRHEFYSDEQSYALLDSIAHQLNISRDDVLDHYGEYFSTVIFNHMKHLWTPSQNLMSVEAVTAELQIRLNCQMKCNDFFFIHTK